MKTLQERVEKYAEAYPAACTPVAAAKVNKDNLRMLSAIEGGYAYRSEGAYYLLFHDAETAYIIYEEEHLNKLLRPPPEELKEAAEGEADYQDTLTVRGIYHVAGEWLHKRPATLDIMVDIESFGQCIPSLAFVPFDRKTGETMPRAGCLLLTLDLDWQMKAGLGCDQDTLKWWLTKTSEDARKALYDLPGSVHIKSPEELGDAFRVLHAAWGITAREEHHRVWGKPASYDWPKIEALCRVGGVPMPFHFRTSRCCRTLAEIGSKPSKQERDDWKAANNIVTHDPYDDCRLQAWEVAQSLRKKEESGPAAEKETPPPLADIEIPPSAIELLRFIQDHEGELTSAQLLRKEYKDDVDLLWYTVLAIPDNSESDILRITGRGKQLLETVEKKAREIVEQAESMLETGVPTYDSKLECPLLRQLSVLLKKEEDGPVFSNMQGTRDFYPGTVYECVDPNVPGSGPVTFIAGHPEDGASCVVSQHPDENLIVLEWDDLGEVVKWKEPQG